MTGVDFGKSGSGEDRMLYALYADIPERLH